MTCKGSSIRFTYSGTEAVIPTLLTLQGLDGFTSHKDEVFHAALDLVRAVPQAEVAVFAWSPGGSLHQFTSTPSASSKQHLLERLSASEPVEALTPDTLGVSIVHAPWRSMAHMPLQGRAARVTEPSLLPVL